MPPAPGLGWNTALGPQGQEGVPDPAQIPLLTTARTASQPECPLLGEPSVIFLPEPHSPACCTSPESVKYVSLRGDWVSTCLSRYLASFEAPRLLCCPSITVRLTQVCRMSRGWPRAQTTVAGIRGDPQPAPAGSSKERGRRAAPCFERKCP